MVDVTDNVTTRREVSSNCFVSCIKVAGLALLPPVITSERKAELQNDKQKAIEIERRLNFQRDLQDFFKQYKLADTVSLDATACDRNLDDILCDNDISHINALDITSPTIGNQNEINMPVLVPLMKVNNDSCIIKPKQRNFDDNDNSDIEEVTRKLFASTVELDLTDIPVVHNDSSITQNLEACSLVRSKTFILSAPSPGLIKRFENRPHTSPAICNTTSAVTELNATLVPHDCNSDIKYSELNTNASTNHCIQSDNCIRSGAALESMSETVLSQSGSEHNFTANALDKEKDLPEDQINSTGIQEEFSIKETFSHNSISNLRITSTSSINIMPDDLNQNDLPVVTQYNLDANSLALLSENYDENDESFFDSQSLIFSNTDILSTSTPNLIDFESDHCDIEVPATYIQNIEIDGVTSVSSVNNMSPLDYPNIETLIETHLCRPDKAQRKIKEKWAAGILSAAVKGYLVRRLKRTERVQNLIKTIRDALLCALSLHTESFDSIQNSDVELHRRLIQQVSAACYEFYGIFFSLSTREKMELIAIDRQRIQDKLKRPKSGTNLKLESNRSTPKSQRQSFSARQRKSVTPTFAA